MASSSCTVRTSRSPEDAFAYLADLRHAPEWSPVVDHARLEEGRPGEVGTRFVLGKEVKPPGRDVRLEYRTAEVEPGRRLRFDAVHARLTATDVLELVPTADGGSEVSYSTKVRYQGWVRLLGPLLSVSLRRGVRGTAGGLRRALGEPGAIT